MARITAHEQPILKVFSDDYAFSIPNYQRPYRWGTDQAELLLKDILEASVEAGPLMAKGGKAGEAISPYFLGSIVVIQPHGPDVDVVDGQQRLTSLSLLLAALRALLPEQDRSKLNGRLLEKGNDFEGTLDRCRLTLRDRDQGFYKTNVLEDEVFTKLKNLNTDTLTEPQANITRNALLFLRELEKLEVSARATLTAFLLQHTYLVVVATESLDSAFRIFSVLNDRGLDLTTADILKADLIGKVAKEKEDFYTRKWEDLDEKLGEQEFDKLISHIVMIHHRQKMRETVLKTFRSVVKADSRPVDFIENELIPYAEAFEVIRNADWDGEKDQLINRTLKWLNRLDNSDWVPSALSLLVKHTGNPDKLHSSLVALERLAVILWLNRVSVNERIERFGRVLADISDGKEAEDASAMQPSKAEVAEAITVLDGDIYNLSPKQKRTLILLRLDECLGSGEANYEFDKITIEHVLPQTPPDNSQWVTWWPDLVQRVQATHRLGNLALLNRRQNAAAKNWDLQTKQTKYFTTKGNASPFLITIGVLKAKEWTPTIFAERQQSFLTLLREAWKL
ncbi:MAG: DUF262 domain-containing protein [Verrucomicrobia bacterium]|nr:DUF262 domain-containing protein [Verrucomicrobiota bacterium]